MKTHYVAEAVVMMLIGITVAALIAWAFGTSSPLVKVCGALYGFFSYVGWRLIVDTSDTAMEECGREDLTPLQGLIALVLPAGIVIGLVILVVIGCITLAVMPKKHGMRPADF
jgi:hypothetical protein